MKILKYIKLDSATQFSFKKELIKFSNPKKEKLILSEAVRPRPIFHRRKQSVYIFALFFHCDRISYTFELL